MDTTGSSLVVEEAYVSCICVDGAPILPPIMTEARRREMRRYRDLAIEREQVRRFSRLNITKPLWNGIRLDLDNPRPSTAGSSSDFSPPTHMHLTSTPRSFGSENESKVFKEETEPNYNNINNNDNKENMMSEFDVNNKMAVLNNGDELTSSKSMSTSTSSNEQVIEEDDVTSLDDLPDSDSGGGNFASIGSSTGTFIIKTNLSREAQKSDKSEGEVEELEGEDQVYYEDVDELKTVLRKSPSEEPMFKRKRPARYFDTIDDCSSKSEQSTFRSTTSSTSLSKYLTLGQAPEVSSAAPDISITPTRLPNVVQKDDTAVTSRPGMEQSPSFTINTDFAATAKALSHEKEKLPRYSKGSRGRSRKSKYFASPDSGSSPRDNQKADSNSVKTTDPNFDFILTNEIPLSARKLNSPKTGELADADGNSDSSDKENRMEKKKHVRKLSYTLETPSAALLAATHSSTVDGNVLTQTLAPIESASNSVGIPSTLNTPIKGPGDNNVRIIPPTPTCGELDVQIDKVQFTLAKFQELSLGKGKKAHLERYLDEQKAIENGSGEGNPESTRTPKQNGAKVILTKLQLDREKQMKIIALKEQFDLQVQKMLEEFEAEQIRVIAAAAVEEHQLQKEVFGSTTPSQSSVLADTSNLRNYYISNETPSKDELNSGILSLRSESSTFASGYFQGHIIPGTPTSQPEQLSTVGLFKLQNKMQKMNPSLFKNPADARSPLLKGLVFPDPLDRPNVPLKIPPEANDPAMKPKFDRITAMVKGYLVRRLLHSEKIQIIIQTVKDTVELLLNLYEESSATENGLQVEPQDEELHRRLLQQLTGTCSSFHDVFFKLSVKERMAIIANDREKIRVKALKNTLNRQNNSPSKKNVSTATLKSIERRLTQGRSPRIKDNQSRKTRKVVQSSSYGFQAGSRTVKPKPVKSYNLSPKRRRMSYWEEKTVKTNRATSAISGPLDNNGNKWAAPESARSTNSASTYSARETSHSSGWSSDTFLVPSSRQGQTSWHSQNSSSSKSRPSTGTSRFSVGNANQPTSGRSVRNSTTRVPWK